MPAKPKRTAPLVTDVPANDISTLMQPGAQKRQPMQGFDDDYVDIVDYIVRSTHKIWEEGGIGRIYNHYAHNVLIHTSDGETYGRDKVIADSMRTMSAFPNIRLFADDVIWSGNDRDGFHSSHRIMWIGTNSGHSIYGPPTGRRVTRYGIAHCFVKENRVVEEWICRDEMALVQQLGFDAHELARKLAAQDAARGLAHKLPASGSEVARLNGQNTPDVFPPQSATAFDDVEYFVRRNFHELWNWRLFNTLYENYADNYHAKVQGYRTVYGLGDYRAYLLAFFAAFSDAALLVDHVCYVPNGDGQFRVATRWTLQGTHDGSGVYGEPTGKRVRIIGITHQQLEQGKFTREWTCFDEFALLKQLYAPA